MGQKREVDQSTVSRLMAARTSPAVKDALKRLLETPVQGGGRGGGRKATALPRVPAARRRAPEATFPGTIANGASDSTDRVREAISGAPDGLSKADVMATTGISGSQWNSAINALLSQGLVTKTGERRGARYHIVETGEKP
jgi:hypothetical protein